MSWVQSTFDGFLVPPNKKQKLDTDAEASLSKKTVKKKDDFVGDNKADTRSQSWWERFGPKKREDLVVNKKKLDEIESWLKGCSWGNSDKGRVLLLTGPSGSGKMSSVRVLCRMLGLGLTEWVCPLSPDPQDIYTPQLKAFAEFVIRATRYKSVLSSASKGRVVVVKDLPNIFLRDPTLFHEVVKHYSKVSGVNLVFIVTDGKVLRELFPDDVKREAGVATVSLNPLTTRVVAGALGAIARRVGGGVSTQALAASSGGDLRRAVEELHFLSVGGQGTPKVRDESDCDGLDLFRGLGRILYPKRDSEGRFIRDLDGTASAFESSASHFTAMLHQNYPTTFPSIRSAALASTTLASADLLLSDYVEAPLSRSLALCLAARGLASANDKPVKRFQQLSRPHPPANRVLVERSVELRTNFPSFTTSTDLLADAAPYLIRIPCSGVSKDQSDLLREFVYLKR